MISPTHPGPFSWDRYFSRHFSIAGSEFAFLANHPGQWKMQENRDPPGKPSS